MVEYIILINQYGQMSSGEILKGHQNALLELIKITVQITNIILIFLVQQAANDFITK